MAINPPDSEDFLRRAIEKGIADEVSDAYDKLKTELVEKLDRQKDQIVSGICLGIMKHVSMERMGPDLHVVIKKIEEK